MWRLLLVLWLCVSGFAPGYAQEIRALDDDAVLDPIPIPETPEDWLVAHGSGVVVSGPGKVMGLLDELAAYGSTRVAELSRDLKVPLGERLHVYVAEDQDQFMSLQPGRPPSWADGTAWPVRGIIFLRAPRARNPGSRPIKQVLDHELVHVLLGRAFYPEHPPRWLQEGYAQVFANEVDADTVRVLLAAGATGSVPTLASLTEGFPADAYRAQVAYAASAHFVQWLDRAHGVGTTVAVAGRMSAGERTAEAALQEVTGKPADELERAWRASLPQGPLRWMRLFSEDVLFAVGAILAFGFGAFRWVRRRRQMAEWSKDERDLRALVVGVLRRNPPT